MLWPSLLRILITRSFKPFVFDGKAYDRLEFAALENLGLYVHIPFCRSLCLFCPYAKELYQAEKAQYYKMALLAEIDLVCRDLVGKKTISSLYFGGGTPALLVEDIGEIIARLKQYFVITGGIGIELSPDDANAETLSKLKAAGVTMVSIGVQSFDKECLTKIGRKYNNFEARIKLAGSIGFDVIDVDLIFAIPGQNEAILARDIETAFANGATQVSTYPFIDFTFADNAYKPLSHRVKKRMLRVLVNIAEGLNLERTSVWTFARKGTQKYSSVTRDNFLGFGASATTLLKDTFKINTFSVDAYIKTLADNRLPTALTLDFTLRQRAAYFLFWGAYGLRLDAKGFESVIGNKIESLFSWEMWLCQRLSLLKKAADGYVLTEKAGYIFHDIEQAYTNAYIDKMWRIARQEPYPRRICLS